MPASNSCMIQSHDTLLINNILSGDTAGYALLVDSYKDLAFTIAFRMLGNREDAEEVVQDAFVKAFNGLAGFRQQARFSTWLYRIVYNTAISRKRLKGIPQRSLEELPAFERTEDEPGDDEDQHIMLEKALEKLPDDEKVLVTLYYLDESSIEDIHAITGLSKANVKIKLFRARKKLQELVTAVSVKMYS